MLSLLSNSRTRKLRPRAVTGALRLRPAQALGATGFYANLLSGSKVNNGKVSGLSQVWPVRQQRQPLEAAHTHPTACQRSACDYRGEGRGPQSQHLHQVPANPLPGDREGLDTQRLSPAAPARRSGAERS